MFRFFKPLLQPTLAAGLLAILSVSHASSAIASGHALPALKLIERSGFVWVGGDKGGGGERIRMQYKLYLPEGQGPFPLIISNHGRNSVPRAQHVNRPIVLALEMVARGYAVIAPMRRGFANSDGSAQINSCVDRRRIDARGLGSSQDWGMSSEVIDLHAFVNQIVGLREVDRTRMVMVSQSGGFTSTLGYMTMPRHGVLGYINFVGGGFSYCGPDENVNTNFARRSGRDLGPRVKRPGLWIYAKQDSYVSATAYRTMFDSFTSAGGKASWVLLEPPIEEGHFMLGHYAAVSTWWPHVEFFLKQLNLPTELRYRVSERDAKGEQDMAFLPGTSISVAIGSGVEDVGD